VSSDVRWRALALFAVLIGFLFAISQFQSISSFAAVISRVDALMRRGWGDVVTQIGDLADHGWRDQAQMMTDRAAAGRSRTNREKRRGLAWAPASRHFPIVGVGP
jgi:hypothetical protein